MAKKKQEVTVTCDGCGGTGWQPHPLVEYNTFRMCRRCVGAGKTLRDGTPSWGLLTKAARRLWESWQSPTTGGNSGKAD